MEQDIVLELDRPPQITFSEETYKKIEAEIEELEKIAKYNPFYRKYNIIK